VLGAEAVVRGRAEWAVFGGCCGKRRERASLLDPQREEKTHGVAAACAARGAKWRTVDSTDAKWWQWPSSCHTRATPASGHV
jgi:hypothetical protein